jgi:3'-phosphoadenosine 5'-phosphosulfate sulfotransferase (PAPS reductase)/FAD synthetase
MALMAACGELQPMPSAAIFADTGDEPKAVMNWLITLEGMLPFPVHRVQYGVISKDFLDPDKTRSAQPPYYVVNVGSDDKGGMLWRECTKNYKLNPIRRKIRQLMKETGTKHVVQWIGISFDELIRMKQSGVRYLENYYPLVEKRLTRNDCLAWLRARGIKAPPKSACWHCPYTSNARWREMMLTMPAEWQKAVQYDEALRSGMVRKGITGKLFLHRSMVPLAEADLRTAEDAGQLNLFINECEGMCGV